MNLADLAIQILTEVTSSLPPHRHQKLREIQLGAIATGADKQIQHMVDLLTTLVEVMNNALRADDVIQLAQGVGGEVITL